MDLVFEGKKQGDYHTEMNSTVFLEWFERLCMALNEPSCIVLDNASYHNTRTDDTISPTSSAKKAELQAWLTERDIAFDLVMTKAELYEIVKRNKPAIVYKSDEIAWKWGHTVLRTPVRQCELNPIELIWARVKYHIAKNNTTFRLGDVKRLVYEAFDSVTPDLWKKCCQRVIDIENQYRATENIIDNIPPVIIDLNSDEEDQIESDSEQS